MLRLFNEMLSMLIKLELELLMLYLLPMVSVGWHPDAKAWMDATFHYLKPGGKLLLVDFHPVLWILNEDFKEVKYPYFNTGVIKEEREGSYASPEAEKMVNYTWNHSISDLVKPIVDHPDGYGILQ